MVGEEHYNTARAVQGTLQRYRELRDIIAIMGMDDLAPEDKLAVARAARSSVSCPSRSTWLKCLPVPRQVRALSETIRGFKMIVNGKVRSPA